MADRRENNMGIKSEHWTDVDDNPAGGSTWGTGFAISWQNGPIGSSDKGANGAIVEDVIRAAIDRIKFYQQTKYACPQNEQASSMLSAALHFLEDRDEDRKRRGVEGKNEI
jgi:hypothetical protein